jgi:hypothetical protein
MAFGPEQEYFNNYSLNTHRATRNEVKIQENDMTALQTSDDNGMALTSTNIFIYANQNIVGMIQSFNIQESRTIDKLNAIGVEGVIQAVPENTNGGTIDVNRIALYSSNLWAALGLSADGIGYDASGSKRYINDGSSMENWDQPTYETNTTNSEYSLGNGSSRYVFKTLKDQRVPLELQVRQPMNGQGTEWYIETYIDCWLSSYGKTYDVGKITVAETCKIDYADVV